MYNPSGILFHNQHPRQFRYIPAYHKALFFFLCTGVCPEFQVFCILIPAKNLIPDALLTVNLKPVGRLVPGIGGGNLYLAVFIDQIGFDVVSIFVILKQFLNIVHPDSNADDADYRAVCVLYPAVYKCRDLIVRTAHFVIVHIQRILLIAVQHIKIPGIFRIIPFHYTVNPIKVIIPSGNSRNQKD